MVLLAALAQQLDSLLETVSPRGGASMEQEGAELPETDRLGVAIPAPARRRVGEPLPPGRLAVPAVVPERDGAPMPESLPRGLELLGDGGGKRSRVGDGGVDQVQRAVHFRERLVSLHRGHQGVDDVRLAGEAFDDRLEARIPFGNDRSPPSRSRGIRSSSPELLPHPLLERQIGGVEARAGEVLGGSPSRKRQNSRLSNRRSDPLPLGIRRWRGRATTRPAIVEVRHQEGGVEVLAGGQLRLRSK